MIDGEEMISKKKLWLKFSLFFIMILIVPIFIFESISFSKNAGSVYRNSNIKRFFTDKLNTVSGRKSPIFSLMVLLSATDRQIKKGDVFMGNKIVEYDSNKIVLVKGKNKIEIPLNDFTKKTFD